ncbi:MAG: MoxR family ATPase [Myxococcota bacterium]
MSDAVERIRREMARVLIGQRELVDGLLVALLCQGHVLVEGVPGLAKTTAVRAFARVLDLDFRRIQFTPDLLPADLLGTQVYDPANGSFRLHRGPLFHNVILADEINRAPAKVQSALLEAMEERQVTLAGETLRLPEPFLVMATQNPVEQEGVYPLPEAQVDRFMLKLRVDYPAHDEEIEIVRSRTAPVDVEQPEVAIGAVEVMTLRQTVRALHVEPSLYDYAVRLVEKSRSLDAVELGGSPRASIYLIEAARARAYLQQRDYVLPEDVKAVAPSVLRHRLLLSYEAEAEGQTPDAIVREVLASVPTP